jgi:hypothetical protein
LKPIALVVARLARTLENVAIEEEIIREKMKVWGRKLPHLFFAAHPQLQMQPYNFACISLKFPAGSGTVPGRARKIMLAFLKHAIALKPLCRLAAGF